MSERHPESRLLLLCARQRFDAAHAEAAARLCGDHDLDWDLLHRAAAFHRLTPLVLVNLLSCGGVADRVPGQVMQRFKMERARNVAMAHARNAKIGEFLRLTGEMGMRVMLVKGAALDLVVYREPWYVVSEDADMLVDRRFAELGDAELDSLRRVSRGQPPVEVEFLRHHDLDMNGVLDLDMAKVWGRARKISVNGRDAYVMSPPDMLVAACINLCRKRYARVKEVVAIAQVIDAGGPIDWELTARCARDCGGQRIVYASLWVARRTLGVELPEGVMKSLRVGTVRGAMCGVIGGRLDRMDHLGAGALKPSAVRGGLQGALRYAGYSGGQLWREIKILHRLRTNPGRDPLALPAGQR